MTSFSSRREFLQGLGTGAVGLGLASSLPLGAAPSSEADVEPRLQIGETIAVARTEHGAVRGFILNGVHVFRGIPYGADTSGENRFLPPKKPAAWSEVRPAIWWGPSAPQEMAGRYANQHYAFGDHWNYDELSEDCLRLNLWTPSLGQRAARPVLVWLHGGGFVNGNAIEQDGYDGENLARSGDVVFVSLNHRLGPLGYAAFSKVGGERFAASGNVGMLDIVLALEWVRDNIAAFGGDPGNVTVIGQSGGGAKVCTLGAMPAARGLFHKAVALSGTSLGGLDQGYAEQLGAAVLAQAGVSDMAALQQMPWPEYLRAADRAARQLAAEHPQFAGFRGGFRPVADGVVVEQGPFFSAANGLAASVPMLITSTFNEQSPSREDASLEAISLEAVKEKLRPRFGEKAGAVVDAYARAFPELKPVEVWSFVLSHRHHVVSTANAKAAQTAPVYVAWFGWHPPLFDGRLRAFHCLDICFWFANTDRMLTHTGGGARPRRLAETMSRALLQFMRTGNPNGGGGLPEWPVYTREKGETLVLNDVPEVKNDPDRTARASLAGLV